MRGVLLCALAAVIVLSACNSPEQDAFAQCVTESGATFYGVFWCPHCASQKNLFGSSIENVDYIECSLPDRSGQTQICEDAGIKAYPTWEFKDGKKIEGQLSLLQLSQLTGCRLPPN